MSERAKSRISLRCSHLPQVMLCGPSHLAPPIPIDNSGVPAGVGSAAHEILADIVREGFDGVPDLGNVVRRWNVEDTKDLNFLCWAGLKRWDEYRERAKILSVEDKLETVLEGDDLIIDLSGHTDVSAEIMPHGEPELLVIDWKSGYLELDPIHQMYGYAKQGLERYPQYGGCWMVTVWLRLGYTDTNYITREQIAQWEEDLFNAILDPRYHPGDRQCLYCANGIGCEARAARVRSSSQDIVQLQPNELADVFALAKRYDGYKMVSKAMGEFKDALKGALRDSGPVDLGDGTELFLDKTDMESVLLNREALEAMSDILHIGDANSVLLFLLDDLKISKKKFLDRVASRAVRGGKGKAMAEAMDSLREVGGVSVTSKEQIKKRKIVKELTDGE